MQTLVQIAYNTILSFGLSESDKAKLMDMLEENEQNATKKVTSKKLKKLSQNDIIDLEMEKWLIKNHFKSKNGVNIIK